MKKTILVTGGAGFIGYNFIKICLKKKYQVVNIDPLKYSANNDVIKIMDYGSGFQPKLIYFVYKIS